MARVLARNSFGSAALIPKNLIYQSNIKHLLCQVSTSATIKVRVAKQVVMLG